jgi:hypothetical protein
MTNELPLSGDAFPGQLVQWEDCQEEPHVDEDLVEDLEAHRHLPLDQDHHQQLHRAGSSQIELESLEGLMFHSRSGRLPGEAPSSWVTQSFWNL